jgi:quinone-modifying oxidoreductase subunit QmoC
MEAAAVPPQEGPQVETAAGGNGKPGRIEPDLDFIQDLIGQAGGTFKKCFQCGTCSGTCNLSPEREPFPRKEMIWAVWGMKDRLLRDPDVWLCYQCNDCSTNCPRGGRPGDVLAAVRRQTVLHYAVPRFLARWVGQPQCIPLLVGIPAALLAIALALRVPIENALGLAPAAGERILFTYSYHFPHWLLNTFFGFFTLLSLVALTAGGLRYWRAIRPETRGTGAKGRGKWGSILATVGAVFSHHDFTVCKTSHQRRVAHLGVFFGFCALTLTTLWVITSRVNPLIRGDFIYPMGLWAPFKILANVGGVAVVAGITLMIWDRLANRDRAGYGTYFDWYLLIKILFVTLSGFATEILHYFRLEPHRHIVYYFHLVLVLALILYLPYSKLAHLIYRSIALVWAERTGRTAEVRAALAARQAQAAEEDSDA